MLIADDVAASGIEIGIYNKNYDDVELADYEDFQRTDKNMWIILMKSLRMFQCIIV